MSNKEQTAVEWLYEQLTLTWYDYESGKEILEQAKEMEKEQIEEAFANGVDDEYEWHINNQPRKNTEQYYNEIYGKDE
jgi:hypothetical protein